MNQCQNCSTAFDSKFCPGCGQKTVHRLTMHDVWHDILHMVTHADKGIFGFAKDMVLRPGLVAKDYLGGARKKYFNPIQYLLIITGVLIFIMNITHFQEKMMQATLAMQGSGVSAQVAQKQKELTEKIMGIFQKNMSVVYMLMLPFFALAAGWLYKKAKLNFAERVLLVTMTNNAAYTLMLFLFYPLIFILPAKMLVPAASLSALLQVGAMVLTNHQFFKGNFWENFIRSLIAYVLGFLMFIIVFILLFVIGAFVYMMLLKK